MKKKNKRLITILIFMAFFASGCGILLFNLKENLIFFYSPTEVFEKQIETTQMIRVGGMVKDESLVKKIRTIGGRQLEEISFVITDFENELVISYIGILPDLFKEGQGVVVEGFLKNVGKFEAKTVLAKHDENYMPPEIKDIKSIKDKKI